MVDIDLSTDFGARVSDHLANDQVVWLTTVGAGGTPQPSPVWFLWDGERVLIYSQPNTPKVRNIERSPRVSLNFNSTLTGGDVVILTGEAEIDRSAPPANAVRAYVEKYAEGMRGLPMTSDQFAQEYSVPIRVRPTRLRGF